MIVSTLYVVGISILVATPIGVFGSLLTRVRKTRKSG